MTGPLCDLENDPSFIASEAKAAQAKIQAEIEADAPIPQPKASVARPDADTPNVSMSGMVLLDDEALKGDGEVITIDEGADQEVPSTEPVASAQEERGPPYCHPSATSKRLELVEREVGRCGHPEVCAPGSLARLP